MGILIGKYEFDGPYNSVTDLQEKPGLFAVVRYEGEGYELIHISEAHNVKELIEISHSTIAMTSVSVLLAACYTPCSRSQQRKMMLDEILRAFDDKTSQQCYQKQLTRAASSV